MTKMYCIESGNGDILEEDIEGLKEAKKAAMELAKDQVADLTHAFVVRGPGGQSFGAAVVELKVTWDKDWDN